MRLPFLLAQHMHQFHLMFSENGQNFKRTDGTGPKRGYKTGINILTTIGHHNENLDNSLKGNYTYMTDINGEVCHGSFCPNDDNMREYIRKFIN